MKESIHICYAVAKAEKNLTALAKVMPSEYVP